MVGLISNKVKASSTLVPSVSESASSSTIDSSGFSVEKQDIDHLTKTLGTFSRHQIKFREIKLSRNFPVIRYVFTCYFLLAFSKVLEHYC
jgi:hypothetical protein